MKYLTTHFGALIGSSILEGNRQAGYQQRQQQHQTVCYQQLH